MKKGKVVVFVGCTKDKDVERYCVPKEVVLRVVIDGNCVEGKTFSFSTMNTKNFLDIGESIYEKFLKEEAAVKIKNGHKKKDIPFECKFNELDKVSSGNLKAVYLGMSNRQSEKEIIKCLKNNKKLKGTLSIDWSVDGFQASFFTEKRFCKKRKIHFTKIFQKEKSECDYFLFGKELYSDLTFESDGNLVEVTKVIIRYPINNQSGELSDLVEKAQAFLKGFCGK